MEASSPVKITELFDLAAHQSCVVVSLFLRRSFQQIRRFYV